MQAGLGFLHSKLCTGGTGRYLLESNYVDSLYGFYFHASSL